MNKKMTLEEAFEKWAVNQSHVAISARNFDMTKEAWLACAAWAAEEAAKVARDALRDDEPTALHPLPESATEEQ